MVRFLQKYNIKEYKQCGYILAASCFQAHIFFKGERLSEFESPLRERHVIFDFQLREKGKKALCCITQNNVARQLIFYDVIYIVQTGILTENTIYGDAI